MQKRRRSTSMRLGDQRGHVFVLFASTAQEDEKQTKTPIHARMCVRGASYRVIEWKSEIIPSFYLQ